MSAFGSPWKDMDDTRPGTPYVVDNNGWGWFFVFLLVAIPFLMVGGLIAQISTWVCLHPILSSLLYLLLAFICGVIFYSRSSMRHRVCGVAAALLTWLPLSLGAGLYMIPYVMLEGSVSSFLDWVLVAALLFGITFFIFSICNLLRNGLIHLFISLLFFVLSVIFIMALISSESDLLSWSSIQCLYGF